MQLEKAIITELDGNTEVDSFPVQFNPTTLRLSLANRAEGGNTTGMVVRQNLGPSSTTLSLDLVFDTADEGTTSDPVSVREKTRKVERFLVPRGSGPQQSAPPRIKFSWGDLIIEGMVESLSVDFEHFAANGAPLRAKVSLSIKGQDREKELTSIIDNRRGAPAPGRSGGGGLGFGAGVGIGFGVSASAGLGVSANIGVALGGESAGEFAARMGVDPAAWRGLDLGGESSLSLSAGVEVGFNTNVSASAGLGVTTGVESGVSAPIEASFGLSSNTNSNAVAGVGVGAELASGFALSSAGGVGSAIDSVQVAKIEQAEQQTRTAFKTPAKPGLPSAAQTSAAASSATVSAQPKPPEQAHTALVRTGLPSISAQQLAPAAPKPPRPDPRSSSYGFGVPMRPTFGEAADRRAETIRGDVSVRPKIETGDPPTTNDPTKPAWVALPVRSPARDAANKAQSRIRPSSPCGCSGRCGH